MRRIKTLLVIGSSLSLCAVLLTVSSTSGATTKVAQLTASTKVAGGTVTWAEPPSAYPNFIFPFMTPTVSSVNNTNQFQYLLYRPLYMFGFPQSTSVAINIPLSLGSAPVYSNGDTQAVINMKTNYKWSNGETVDADDVLFFMNMLHAEKSNWYDYTPGYFPDNVKSVTVNSPSQITIVFTKGYNPTWMTDNEFGQITPFPKAWDIDATGAAAGSGGCFTGAYGAASTDAACTKVYNFLNAQAQNISGYSTNPIWAVVDGPFTIASSRGGAFNTSGAATLVPNPDYSGPQKPTISALDELPFTSEASEVSALLGGKLDVGYIASPAAYLKKPTSNPLKPGPNNPRLAKSFYMSPWVLFGFNYGTLKFLSTGDGGNAGKIFSQLYVRQAMQMLINQPAIIKRLLLGYGVPTYGPVPVLPNNPYVDSYEKSNPYPYNPSKAKSLLSSHGWKVVPGGIDTCQSPGSKSNECGAGIPKGAKLDFTYGYPTGTPWQKQTVEIEQSSWNSVGIRTTLSPATFDTVISDYVPPCTPGTPCTLEIGWWGGGWEYTPDWYPSGETLVATGAGSNSSNYSNSEADSLIAATTDTSANLDAYQNYIAKQLPFFWQPNADYELTEISNNLKGIAPQNPYSILFPEYWYFTK